MLREIVKFSHSVGKLKRVGRRGWISQVGVTTPESVADHSFRCAILAMCIGDLKGIDTNKLVRMALLHDAHEALIGDYDVFEKQRIGLDQAKKNQEQAIKEVFDGLPETVREKYVGLAEEYLRQETPESKLVKQIDQLEMIMQASEYEKEGYDKTKLQTFWNGVEGKLPDPDLKAIFELLRNESS
jgi:putative hydrolase of HD superfamily